MSDEQTLAGLIADRKGTRSYEKVSQDCGGIPTSKRLHQLATQKPKNFPDPDTIRGLAQGLGVTITDIVMASARSLGLPVYTGNDPSALAIGGAGDLPDSTKEVLSTVAREFIKLTSQRTDGANHESDTEEVPEPGTQEGGTKHRRKAGADRVRPGAPMIEEDHIRDIRRTALLGHYQWVRDKAAGQRDLKLLLVQAEEVLTGPYGGGLDETADIDPEIDDGAYSQYLAWRSVLSASREPRPTCPLDTEGKRLADRRWRREFSELVLWDRVRTVAASEEIRDLAVQVASAQLATDPASGSGGFLNAATAQVRELHPDSGRMPPPDELSPDEILAARKNDDKSGTYPDDEGEA
ncbi:hypothetical protein [Rhodococcus sp. YH1]|uniref:hypothetical protein n=1 Tax=Rhodococcus sp. YH1 TaxID=89066 RepID=UPI0013872F40